jgi:hypothetical protein
MRTVAHAVAGAHALFHRFVLRRAWTSFVVMGLSFLGFGIGTVSLATVLKANLDLVFNFGWQALMDGAARQLLELLFNGYVAMAFYVVFKACEHRLVHGLGEPPR